MDERALALTEFIGNRLFMKMREGRCTALEIDPERRRFSCAIYEMRPDVCRSLDRGSGACRADYEAKADRPDVAIERLREPRSQS